MTSEFNAHGSSRHRVSNNILIADTTGPWNRQGLQQAQQSALKASQQFNGNPFGVITIVRGIGVYTPDAEAFAHQAIRGRADAGGRCIAIIYASQAAIGISSLQLIKLYNANGIDAKDFTAAEPAISWMASNGFTLANPADLTDWL